MHFSVCTLLAFPFSSPLSLPVRRRTVLNLRRNHLAGEEQREVGAGQLHGRYSRGVLRFLVRTLRQIFAGLQRFGDGY